MTTENTNGHGTSQLPANGEPSDSQEPDFVLSEETLHKLPTETRAVAALALRLDRENALLKARLAEAETPDQDDDDEPAPRESADVRKAKVEALLNDLIPDEGHEAIAPGTKKVLSALIQQVEEQQARLDSQEKRFATVRQEDMWNNWKATHKDWKEVNEPMGELFTALGAKPQSIEQIDAAYEVIKKAARATTLERELETTRKGGGSPRLGNTPPSLVNRLANPAGRKGRSENWNELFAKSYVTGKPQP